MLPGNFVIADEKLSAALSFFPSSTFHLLFQVDNENVRVIGGNFQLRKRSTFIEEWFSSQVRKVFLFKGTIDHFEGNWQQLSSASTYLLELYVTQNNFLNFEIARQVWLRLGTCFGSPVRAGIFISIFIPIAYYKKNFTIGKSCNICLVWRWSNCETEKCL